MWPHAAGGDARVKIAQKGVLCAGNTHKRMRRYVAGSVMVWAIVVLAASAVNAQEAIVDTAANGAGSGLGSPQSLLDVIGQAGGFQWPILGVFVLGMAAVIQALVRVQGEKRRARALAGLTVPVAKTSDFEIATQQGGDSLHHRIMDAIMKRLELDASSEGLLAAAERAVEPGPCARHPDPPLGGVLLKRGGRTGLRRHTRSDVPLVRQRRHGHHGGLRGHQPGPGVHVPRTGGQPDLGGGPDIRIAADGASSSCCQRKGGGSMSTIGRHGY